MNPNNNNKFNKISNNSIKTIKITPELEIIIKELIDTSLLSSEQNSKKYMEQQEYQDYKQQTAEQTKLLISKIQEIRKNNSNLSDSDFYKQIIISFLTPVVSKIEMQYKTILPQQKLEKIKRILNTDNIVFTSDENQNDIQADDLTGKLIINPRKTFGNTLEEKIVSSLGVIIHETFHLMINMLKDPTQAEQLGERLMYKVSTSNGELELHFAPGKYGQVLSEGFVEKLSSEFSKKNGFYYTLNPSYIPCVKLCTELMKQDPAINEQFLFTKSADDIVDKMTPELKSEFEEAERLFVFNNFKTKEEKMDKSLTGISSENVIASWMEIKGKVQQIKPNKTFKQSFIIKKVSQIENIKQVTTGKEASFSSFKNKKEKRQQQLQNINIMSTNAQKTYQQLKQTTKNHNQTKKMEKKKVKKFSGFINITILIGILIIILLIIIYYICK